MVANFDRGPAALTAAVFVVASIVLAGVVSVSGRTWASADGRELEGELRSATETEVEILRADGRAFTVPLGRLGLADQAFVRAYLDEQRRNLLLKEGPFAMLVTGQWAKSTSEEGLPFQIFGSPKLDPEGRYPLVVYLHGAGGRGVDNEKQMEFGARVFAQEENFKARPCFVIAPQCPPDESWGGGRGEDVVKLVGAVVDGLPVDPERIYLTGFSMGGWGTWHLLASAPGRFAAGVPIAGGGNPRDAEKLRDVPVWVFHGDADDQVDVKHSRDIVAALEKLEAPIKYTEYPGMGHLSDRPSYQNPELHEWLFAQGVEEAGGKP